MSAEVPEAPSAPAGGRVEIGVFALSAALLALEVLETKIFAFSLDLVTVYTAIGICQLGLGVAATVIALGRTPGEAALGRLGLPSGVAAGVAVVAAHALFAKTSGSLADGGWLGVATLVALTSPYFFLGIGITLALVARARAVPRVYAANLAGSSVGCLIVFPLLDAFGAERSLVVLAALAVAGGAALAGTRAARAGGAVLAAGVAIGAALMPVPGPFGFEPDRGDQLGWIFEVVDRKRGEHPGESIEMTRLFTRWDRTSRVDVHRLDSEVDALQSTMDGAPVPTLSFMQDGSAGSFLVGVGDDLSRARALFEDTVYGAGYVLGRAEDVMIIGLGGAPDVQAALYYGARHVDAVEINGTTIDIAREEFREFLGDPYGRPEVIVHEMDGRAFLRGDDRHYDLIQMSGVDTKSIFAAGNLAVSENLIYTREAMNDILRRLAPDGIAALIRAGDVDAHRLASLAVAGLRDLGVAQPARHLFVLSQGLFRAVLIKRTPFTAEELGALHAWVEAREGREPDISIPAHEWLLLSFRHPLAIQYSPPPRAVGTTPFFRALTQGRSEAFVEKAKLDLRPPVDDRPFFFLRERPVDLLRTPPLGLQRLYRFVVQLAVLSIASILLPLALLRGRGLGAAGAGPALLYFFCLGAGFMLVEIALIQRFVLLLGHQSYAVTVVLFALLAGAGLGSLHSSRLAIDDPGPLRRAIALVVGAVLLYGFALQAVFSTVGGAPFGVRLAVSVVLLASLGFLLGRPFPTALRGLAHGREPLLPWGIGVNAVASVFGATAAVPVAMLVGLRVVLLVGCALYLLAWLTAPSRATVRPG